jgi:hypothetical protein
MTGTPEPELCKPDAEPGAHSCNLADDHEGPHICPRCGGKWVFAATCEPASDPLVMPVDEFALVKTVAEKLTDGDCDRLWRMLSEHEAVVQLAALDRAVERMNAAEGKLAEIAAYCRDECEVVNEGLRLVAIVRASDILGIIDRKEPGNG